VVYTEAVEDCRTSSRYPPGTDRPGKFHRVHASRIRQLLSEPRRIPPALLRRLLPNHPRFGNSWVRLTDGSITFREAGFVAADTPASLLARHNYEVVQIRRLLRTRRFRHSLDIGCGYGRLTPIFAEFSEQHTAIDINSTALATARGTYPEFDFRLGSATELHFPDGQFDLVTTWTVLQHISPDRIRIACAELRRVLAPGGMLLLCEETRLADRPMNRRPHTWHRRSDDYKELFSPLEQTYCGVIEEIIRIPGVEPPGTVMVWIR
jgi:SAM-dependent methyltransferase